MASVEDVAVGEIGAIFESATDFAPLIKTGCCGASISGDFAAVRAFAMVPDGSSVSFSSFVLVLVLDCSSLFENEDGDEDGEDPAVGGRGI